MFEIKTTHSSDKNKIVFQQSGKYDFVGRSYMDNGVQGKVNKLHFEPNPKESFSLVQVGESVCLYRKNEWYASQNIFILIPLNKDLTRVHHFISSCINKALWKYKDAYVYPTLADVKNIVIKVPVKNNKIDFIFMELFIAELEAQRVAELSAYLRVSGFANYELSDAELNILHEYSNLEFAEFNVLDIFTVKNTSNLLLSDIVKDSGKTPYLCASSENNSVSTYIQYDESFLEEGNCIFIGGKTFVVSYQEKDFYSNDSHNLALYLNNQAFRNKLNQLYITTCVYKSLSHRYSWGNSVSKSKIKDDKISLPTKNGVPDFDTMEIFISAIQKLVIKDVVKYSDAKIDATKKIIL